MTVTLNFLIVAALQLLGGCLASNQNTSTVDEIINACYSYLESNLCEGENWGHRYHFYKPSAEKYSSDQWLWDSGAHMIVWSHRDVQNSVLDLRSMLRMQQANGRIPEEIFWMDRDVKETAAILLEYSNPKAADVSFVDYLQVFSFCCRLLTLLNCSPCCCRSRRCRCCRTHCGRSTARRAPRRCCASSCPRSSSTL